MKTNGIGNVVVLMALYLVACTALTGQGRQGEKQGQAQQQSRQSEAQPRPQVQQQARPSQSQSQRRVEQTQQSQQQQIKQRAASPQPKSQDNRQAVHQQLQRPNAPSMQPQERRRVLLDHRAGNWESTHQSWQQRGGYVGYRIPQARFSGYFGSNHLFRIGGLPFLVIGGFPRFQYGGYWFSMIDPWPGDWSDDWYESDDCYVAYQDNGYYLYNRRHPGIGIAISVSM